MIQSNLEQKLGFDRLRQMVAGYCSNSMALRMSQEMTFSSDYDEVLTLLRQTDEMRRIVMFHQSFPSQDFFDLTDTLASLRIENTSIGQQDLFNLKCSLLTIEQCLSFLLPDDSEEGKTSDFPCLSELAQRVSLEPDLLRQANKIIDDKGEIFDNASPDLLLIRQQLMRKQGDVDVYLNRALQRAKREGWAPENAEPTIRNGRTVIPMLDTHRRKIRGLIHDESATRQTAYLEPAEVVELNNDIRELQFAEHREILRILLVYSNLLRPHLHDLIEAYWFLARIDFIRAKARLALQMEASLPIVDNAVKIEWMDARHPLLFLQRKSDGNRQGEVVPFALSLSSDRRILIISGPNAGGKSVLLKAVGLIQYMLQCGLLVPCRATSEFGIFSSVFIDIGDQQSIDNDLSTYSSHLNNMKQLLDTAGNRTLFLLDELGGGTEPRSGCAIAEALLEELDMRHSLGVVTTHFADLKLLADSHPAIVNGAMLFDTDKMCPLYHLSIGRPGSSFAFEIAATVGLPPNVLENARGKVGVAMLNFEHQLQELELEKQRIAEQKAQLEAADSFLSEVVEKYQHLYEQLETRRHEIISEARNQARTIIDDANSSVEQTIRDIKTANAERERTMQARKKLAEKALSLQMQQEEHDNELKQKVNIQPKSKPTSNKVELSDAPIVVGMIVSIDGHDTYGQVVEIKGKKAVVESNSIRMTISLERLRATAKRTLPVDKTAQRNNRFQSIYNDINEKRKAFNPTIDLRGQRADEALLNLQHFFDDAILLGEKELRILHGKGFGILKQMIRDWLQSNRDVQSFRSERLELGGDGITVVQMR